LTISIVYSVRELVDGSVGAVGEDLLRGFSGTGLGLDYGVYGAGIASLDEGM
jgi:hypothetical protein